MELDGVEASIVYPSQGLLLYSVPDSELLSALCRAYNNWLADFCHPFPHRIKGIAMLNLDDVQEGVSELTRCARSLNFDSTRLVHKSGGSKTWLSDEMTL